MKIMVLGASGIGNQLSVALAHKQIEVVTIESLNDIEPNEGDVIICEDEPTPNQRQLAMLDLPMSCLTDVAATVDVPERDTSFRGGSRGKGGKIKYQRK